MSGNGTKGVVSLARKGETVLTMGGVASVPLKDSPLRAHGDLHYNDRKKVPAQRLTLAPAGPLRPKPPCGRSHANGEGTRGTEPGGFV